MGYPVVLNNDQDSALSTNKRLVLFGDFGSYVIQDAGPPIFVRADELRVLNHQSVFLAFQRSDGNLIDTAAVKYLRTA